MALPQLTKYLRKRLGVHYGKTARRPRERDVQRPQPLRLLADDALRFDDDDRIELETLHQSHWDEVHLGVEPATRRFAEVDAGGTEGVTRLVEQRVGHD